MKGYILEWAGLYQDAISHFLKIARSEEHHAPKRLVCYCMAAKIASLLGVKDLVSDISREVGNIGEEPLKSWIKMSIAGYLRVAGRTGKVEVSSPYKVGNMKFTIVTLPLGVRVKGFVENPSLEPLRKVKGAEVQDDHAILKVEIEGIKCIAFLNVDGALDIRIPTIIESSEEGLKLAIKAVEEISSMVKP